jgi:hypothetical protein
VAVQNAIRVSAEWVAQEMNARIEEQVKQFGASS